MELNGPLLDQYTIADTFDDERKNLIATEIQLPGREVRSYRYRKLQNLHEVLQRRMRSVTNAEDVWLSWGFTDFSYNTLTEIRIAREPGVRDSDGMSVQMRFVSDEGLASDPFVFLAMRRGTDIPYCVVSHQMIEDENFTFMDIAMFDTESFFALDVDTIRDFYEHHADNVQPSRVD